MSERPERVYFFGTCLIDMCYPQAGMAGIELLQREGVKVIFPKANPVADNRHIIQAFRQKPKPLLGIRCHCLVRITPLSFLPVPVQEC